MFILNSLTTIAQDLGSYKRDTMNVYISDETVLKYPLDNVDSVMFIQATGNINGHEYIDLGLSVKWATCNIGAQMPENAGNRFAWGETTTKSRNSSGNSTTYNMSMKDTVDISGIPTYDAATANWGAPWRIPTRKEFKELVQNCTFKWLTYNDVNGCLITGPNGNTIFLPKVGYSYSTSSTSVTQYAGNDAQYWTSTSNGGTYSSYYFLMNSSGAHNADNVLWRYYGMCIRPVTD